MDKNQRLQAIRDKLQQTLSPNVLEITDESHKHIGHAGASSGAGHYKIVIASPAFNNKSTIENHRLIYQALQELMETDIHALSIKIIR